MSAPNGNGPSALGKIPAQGDFLRIRAGGGAARALHVWLEEAHEAVRRAGALLPEAPLRFVFTAPGEREALIGAMGRSEDRVGRSFPLCVFRTVDGAHAAEHLCELPIAFASFLDGAEALIASAAELGPEDLAARLDAMEPQSRGDFALAGAERRLRAAASAGAHLRELQAGSDVPGNVYYGLRTFVLACRPEQRKEPVRPGVTLDCPIPEGGDASVWLELAQVLLGWRTLPPALFWTSRRLLLCVGTPGPSVLVHVALPGKDSTKVWPLRTQVATAVDAAKQALTADQRAAIDAANTTVEELVRQLAG